MACFFMSARLAEVRKEAHTLTRIDTMCVRAKCYALMDGHIVVAEDIPISSSYNRKSQLLAPCVRAMREGWIKCYIRAHGLRQVTM